MGAVSRPVATSTTKVKECMTCHTVYFSNHKRRCCATNLTIIGWITKLKESNTHGR